MRVLFYDTETTGLPLFKEPSGDPRQPHIVQVAAHLVDEETRFLIASINLTVRPDGWVIPDDVAAIHGIDTESALEVGVPEHLAVAALIALWRNAEHRVGHNEAFDARIVRIALKRLGFEDGEALADEWKAAPAKCTARQAGPHCALPPTAKMRAANRNHHNTPTLQEAYSHFFGANFVGAHDAEADVIACRAVYFRIRELESPVNFTDGEPCSRSAIG